MRKDGDGVIARWQEEHEACDEGEEAGYAEAPIDSPGDERYKRERQARLPVNQQRPRCCTTCESEEVM